ncbi:AraC family transcriptional regulator [Sulfurimonas sp.]|nr:AraC family transcriptional regulator [Sulfurimonas sp.]
MDIEVFKPTRGLEGIVKIFIVLKSLDDIHKMIFLPDGGNFMIFNRGTDINVKLYTEDDVYDIPSSYSVGFKTNKVKYIFDAKYKNKIDSFPMVIVELLPLGLFKLFNQDLSLVDYQYKEIDEEIVNTYFSDLYAHSNIEEDIKYLDKSLRKLEYSHNHSHFPLENVINRIASDYHLEINVEDLLNEFNYSRSTLERHFKRMIGLTPKQFIYVSKFCRTLVEYINEKKTLGELPYLYSDSSHMNSVFKKFLGVSPSEILSKVDDGEFKVFQAHNLIVENRDI